MESVIDCEIGNLLSCDLVKQHSGVKNGILQEPKIVLCWTICILSAEGAGQTRILTVALQSTTPDAFIL
jgi:hypothetical protein